MYKLGIDIGTNSIGWAVVEIEKRDNKITPLNLIDFGVRIFNNGLTQDTNPKSLASERNSAKSSRRNQDRYLDRRKRLFDALVKYHLMPESKEEQKQIEYLNPYQCRSECAMIDLHKSILLNGVELKKRKEKIKVSNPLYILGRALFCINQHRGFKSLSESDSKIENAHKKLRDLIAESNSPTLGAYHWKLVQQAKEKVRFRSALDDKGNLKGENPFPSRAIYEEEIRYMFETQRKYFPELSQSMEDEFVDIIITQGNLQKQQPKNCIFDNNPVIQLAQPLFQKFRIVSEVNNLEIDYPNDMKLSLEDKKKLINGLWTCDKALEIKDNVVSYSAIKDFLNLSEDVLFNFETKKIYKYKGKDKDGKNEYEEIYKPLVRDGLKCSETNNLIYKYINNFNDFSDSDKYDIIEILTDYSKFADERVNLLQKYGIKLDRIQVNKLLKDLKRGYCNLSKEILLKILPIMENENKTYDKAFESFNLHHSEKEYQKPGYKIPDNLDVYPKYFSEYLGKDNRITNTTVHIALNQIRIVVNEIIQKYGNPECVAVEVARDVCLGEKTKSKIEANQKLNKQINDEARRFLISQGKQVSPSNLEKYKVWRNLCPFDASKRIDIYDISGEHPIDPKELFDGNKWQIEHILPFSITGDDSFANKIITNTSFNGNKGEKFPSEWKTNPDDLKILQSRAGKIDFYRARKSSKKKDETNNKPKKQNNKRKEYKLSETWWRFLPNAKDIYERITGGMSARDINDTRYITKLTCEYLHYISLDWKADTVNTGTTTDLYRYCWNLLHNLPGDFYLWVPQGWQQNYLSDILRDVSITLDISLLSDDNKKKLDEKVKGIIADLLKGNPESYNNLVDKFDQFVLSQKNKINDNELLNQNEVDEETQIIKRDAFDKGHFKFEKINVDNLSDDEKKEACYQLFYNLSNKQKDRAIHYHHAIDAIVCACLDNALATYPNKKEFRNEIDNRFAAQVKPSFTKQERDDLRKSIQRDVINDKLGGRITPYKNFDANDLKKRFLNMLVSYEESDNKVKRIRKEISEGKNKSKCSFAQITDGTAYSIYDNCLDNDDKCKFLEYNRGSQKRNKKPESISSMIPVFKTKEQKKLYLELFDKYFIDKLKKSIGKISKEEFEDTKKKFETSFSKDKAYKWYGSSGNYEAQIFMLNNGKWQMEVINRYRVFEHFDDKNGYALWHKLYPTAKKIMTLRINDIVKVNIKKNDKCNSFGELKKFITNKFEKFPDKTNLDFYFRVKNMSDGVITLIPIHIAQADKNRKIWSGKISTLQKYNIKKVYFDALGKEIIHSNLNKEE